MKININDYVTNKASTQAWYLKYGEGKAADSVAVISCASMVPCLVTCFWIGEIDGWPQEIIDKINMLIRFYGYTKIIGVPEGYPGEKI